jgi:hypothetical protein
MKYALLILIFLQSSLHAFEFVIGPGADADSLLLQKPAEFVVKVTSSGGWARTDKGDVEFGSCVYLDPNGRFSVGWEHFAGKVRRIYFSRGPNKVAFKEASLVKVKEGQEMVLDTETGDFKIAAKAKR